MWLCMYLFATKSWVALQYLVLDWKIQGGFNLVYTVGREHSSFLKEHAREFKVGVWAGHIKTLTGINFGEGPGGNHRSSEVTCEQIS